MHSYNIQAALGEAACMQSLHSSQWSSCSILKVVRCTHANRPLGHGLTEAIPLPPSLRKFCCSIAPRQGAAASSGRPLHVAALASAGDAAVEGHTGGACTTKRESRTTLLDLPVLWISLKANHQRRASMESQISEAGIHRARYVTAVTASWARGEFKKGAVTLINSDHVTRR